MLLSHPSRVRGLKYLFTSVARSFELSSHPSRVRGLKYLVRVLEIMLLTVAPFAGAWIEILSGWLVDDLVSSRTLRGCVD